MKNRHPLLTKIAGLGLASIVRNWMRTLDFRAVHYDRSADPADPDCLERGIYIFWHEYIPSPLFLRGHCDLAMLMSRHRDADLLSRLALHFGFDFVRGSTARGGDAAIRELMRKGNRHHLTITPDGPRGPRRRLAAGCIYLASKTQMPLIPLGWGYDRPWRLATWDRFAVPRPFSRARCVLGPRMAIPPNLDRDGIERYRLRVERVLDRITLEAEAWAVAGSRKVGEIQAFPTPKALPSRAASFLDQFATPSPARPLGSSGTRSSVRRAA